jgi:aspartate racemase
MHRVAQQIEKASPLALLHIADPVGSRAQQFGVTTVGLLGTRFTMEAAFYRDRLERRYGLTLLVPEEPERLQAHRIIYEELCTGQVIEPSRQFYRQVVGQLVARGAQAIILGCTEISLLLCDSDSPVPLLDTTTLHAVAAVDRALPS